MWFHWEKANDWNLRSVCLQELTRTLTRTLRFYRKRNEGKLKDLQFACVESCLVNGLLEFFLFCFATGIEAKALALLYICNSFCCCRCLLTMRHDLAKLPSYPARLSSN